jgi:hypothetical protein
MKIELTKEQLNNLKVFLARVDLKGAEVPAFVEIMQVVEKGVAEDGE